MFPCYLYGLLSGQAEAVVEAYPLRLRGWAVRQAQVAGGFFLGGETWASYAYLSDRADYYFNFPFSTRSGECHQHMAKTTDT